MICLEGVSKKFKKKNVIDEVSFMLGQGDIMGLVGINGVGKTTLLRMMGGILAPDKGTVQIQERDISQRKVGEIGYLPEETPLYNHLKVKEYLDIMMQMKGIIKTSGEELDWKELDFRAGELKTQRIGSLSQGMRQKVGIMQAYLGKPKAVLLDEPMTGLDPEQRYYLKQFIKKRGTTTLISSHQLDEVQELCNRIIILDCGKIAWQGKMEQLWEKTNHYVDIKLIGDTNKLVQEWEQKGWNWKSLMGSNQEFRIEGLDESKAGVVFDSCVASQVKLVKMEWGKKTLEDIFIELISKEPSEEIK